MELLCLLTEAAAAAWSSNGATRDNMAVADVQIEDDGQFQGAGQRSAFSNGTLSKETIATRVFSDSQAAFISQMNGVKISSQAVAGIRANAGTLVRAFRPSTASWVPRWSPADACTDTKLVGKIGRLSQETDTNKRASLSRCSASLHAVLSSAEPRIHCLGSLRPGAGAGRGKEP